MAQPGDRYPGGGRRIAANRMERKQAEGVARTLGTELGAHVAVQRDRHAGFEGIRAQVDSRFAEVDARFAQVDARITRVEAEIHAMGADLRALGAHIEALGDRLTGLDRQFKLGFGRLAAMLAGVIG